MDTVHSVSNTPLYIVLSVIAIGVIIFESIAKKKFHSSFRRVLKFFFRWPAITIISCTIVVIFIVYTLDHGGGFFTNSSLLSILGVIGIFGTIIGIVFTYEQIKIAEDRIDGYDKLYTALDEFLKDKRATCFHFYGPTLLPGHIAHLRRSDIETYHKNLQLFITNLSFKYKESVGAKLIVPAIGNYDESYGFFCNSLINKTSIDGAHVKKMIAEVEKLQDILRNSSIINTWKPGKEFIRRVYYFYNGVSVIYVVPLHYQHTMTEENLNDKKKIEPVLIGFKTSNSSFIKSFEQDFEALTEEVKKNNLQTDNATLSSRTTV